MASAHQLLLLLAVLLHVLAGSRAQVTTGENDELPRLQPNDFRDTLGLDGCAVREVGTWRSDFSAILLAYEQRYSRSRELSKLQSKAAESACISARSVSGAVCFNVPASNERRLTNSFSN